MATSLAGQTLWVKFLSSSVFKMNTCDLKQMCYKTPRHLVMCCPLPFGNLARGQQHWKVIAAFGTRRAGGEARRNAELAASVLEGLEVPALRAGRKETERDFLWTSILCLSVMTWCVWLLITASPAFLHVSCSLIQSEYPWLSSIPSNCHLGKRIHVLGLVWSCLYVGITAS